MGLVTERTKQGLRLRIVVPEGMWDRVQRVSSALQMEDREVLHMSLALGLRYFDLVANPATKELVQAVEERAEREADELRTEVASIRGET